MDVGVRVLRNIDIDCGADMLHIRSDPYDTEGFGDTSIIVLVNPADVVSWIESWKFGVARCYFATVARKPLKTYYSDKMKSFDKEFLGKEIKILETEQRKNKDLPINFWGQEIDAESYRDLVKSRITLYENN